MANDSVTKNKIDFQDDSNNDPLSLLLEKKDNYQNQSMIDSLKEVIPNLNDIIQQYNIFERKTIDQDKYQLTRDECASIYFYTLHIPNQNEQVYSQLNKALNSYDKETLYKWSGYLNFLLNGLSKIPPMSSDVLLYRAIPVNVLETHPSPYQINRQLTFYSFVSTTRRKSTSFGNKKRTLFIIKNHFSGRSLQNFSFINKEEEVLFPPGSTFKITKILQEDDSVEIQMIQIKSFYPKLFEERSDKN
eukprot:TRINITY_DN11539_c0_g1_i2.p1 TRINITY_DN11539_c0_g1~~TRINITY_DN11539_c0_g1_i2.p1  ORF type:complete len:246 (-),score=65.75 TRINITY_DN11539_c0_g1_i2:39-776(-)